MGWFLFPIELFHVFMFKSYPTHLSPIPLLHFPHGSYFCCYRRRKGGLSSFYPFLNNFYIHTNHFQYFSKNRLHTFSNYNKIHCTWRINDTTSEKNVWCQILQDGWYRTARRGLMGQDILERTARTGQSEHENKEKTARTWELGRRVGQDSWIEQ